MLKIAKKSIVLLLVALVGLMPAYAIAQGKISNMKKGQKAPFDGTLFDLQASADITVRLENHKAQCDLRLTREKQVCETEGSYKLNLKIAELEALQQRHTDILNIKNNQIQFLQKKAMRDVPWYENNKLWFAVGVVAGFAVSFGSAYAWGQVAQ